jgi:hypothetical protein
MLRDLAQADAVCHNLKYAHVCVHVHVPMHVHVHICARIQADRQQSFEKMAIALWGGNSWWMWRAKQALGLCSPSPRQDLGEPRPVRPRYWL